MSLDGRVDYEDARKKGLKASNAARFSGENPYLPALDNMIRKETILSEVSLGTFEIPINKIKGTKTVGRSSSFAPNFLPILSPNTEFGSKWMSLCQAHLNEGIRDAIKVYEYLNWFYVEEGNKRVSVLKFHDAVFINADVTRLIPKYDPEDDTIVLYYEFLDFYKQTHINYIWMSEKEGFKKLLLQMKKYKWVNVDGQSDFKSVYYQFRRAYYDLGGDALPNTTGDAFLKYLEIYKYDKNLTPDGMRSQIEKMWSEFELLSKEDISVEVSTDSLEKKTFLEGLATTFTSMKSANIAFINSKSPEASSWTYGHEIGRNHITNIFGDKIDTKAFNNVPEDDRAYDHIVGAVKEGYDIIFTTSPTFINATLKAAVEFTNVKFFNCSENMSYKKVRTYFGRFYEPNFLVGMIAGAMTKTNNIGYVVTYPIPEVISSINAFTIGARFVNPHATVMVKWVSDFKNDTSEETYGIDKQLRDMNVDIISHQESSDLSTKLQNSGIYLLDEQDPSNPNKHNYLATPIWNWGEFYEKMVRNIMNGAYTKISNLIGAGEKAINYWWGMDTEVVDIIYSRSSLPKETIQSVKFMKEMIIEGNYHPFTGPLFDNKGQEKLGEDSRLTTDDILTMDWFVEGVLGSIPSINALEANHPLLELLSVKKKY